MNPRLGIILIGVSILILGGSLLVLNSNKKPSAKIPSPTTAPTSSIPLETAVTLNESGFNPKEIRIKAGNAVRFTNESETASVNSADHPSHTKHPEINLGEFAKGTMLSQVLTKKGVYTYHNHYKPSQKGVIIVE